jgi:hypothetical protein
MDAELDKRLVSALELARKMELPKKRSSLTITKVNSERSSLVPTISKRLTSTPAASEQPRMEWMSKSPSAPASGVREEPMMVTVGDTVVEQTFEKRALPPGPKGRRKPSITKLNP